MAWIGKAGRAASITTVSLSATACLYWEAAFWVSPAWPPPQTALPGPTAWGTTNSQLGTVWRLTYGNGTFLADAGQLMSTDGINWVRRPDTGSPVVSTSFGEGIFIGVQDGQVATSRDGVQWIRRATVLNAIGAFVAGNDSFLAIGSKGRIAQSACLSRVLSIQAAGSNACRLELDGVPQFDYVIQRSPDLQNWAELASVTNLQSGFTAPITTSGEPGAVFYRAGRH